MYHGCSQMIWLREIDEQVPVLPQFSKLLKNGGETTELKCLRSSTWGYPRTVCEPENVERQRTFDEPV